MNDHQFGIPKHSVITIHGDSEAGNGGEQFLNDKQSSYLYYQGNVPSLPRLTTAECQSQETTIKRQSKLDPEDVDNNYMMGDKGLLYYTQNVPQPKASNAEGSKQLQNQLSQKQLKSKARYFRPNGLITDIHNFSVEREN